MLTPPIQLIVGLCNPGVQYAETRHNVGAWLVEKLAEDAGVSLKEQSKLYAHLAKITVGDETLWLMTPTTFMNQSGLAVQAVCHFYKIPTNQTLIIHDELDFAAGTIRFKQSGGHGGHNGLRDVIQRVGKDFHRLRIGIGHPGDPNKVSNYVLKRPSSEEESRIRQAISRGIDSLPGYILGEQQKAIQALHATDQ